MKHKPSGIILSGGQSRRMGTDKKQLHYGSRTFLEHAVETLRPFCSEIIISVQNPLETVPEGTRAVHDRFPGKGPLAGLHAALAEINETHALVIPVDMPLIHPDMLHALVKNTVPGKITVFEMHGKIQAFPGIYPVRILSVVEKMLRENRLKFMNIFEQTPAKIIDGTGFEPYFANLNTPHDLAKHRLTK